MSDSKAPRPALVSRELLGMGLFTLAAFPVVLVAMALASGAEAVQDAAGTKAIAQAIVNAVGHVPALVCAGGFALVGAAMALSGRDVDVGRNLSGFLFSSIGVAVCLGALRPAGEGLLHGGVFGDATGGTLRTIGPWAGLVIGGAVAFAAVWLAWLGGMEEAGALFRGNGGQTPTISDALSERDSDGVSSAEANALVPDEETLTYMEGLWQDQKFVQPEPIPPSPYPEDVRLQGGVPEGAAPLATDDDEFTTYGEANPGAATWRPAEAERRSEDTPGGDLAGDELPAAAAAAAPPGQDETGTVATALTAEPAPGPPMPSWEQPPLFEVESAQTEEEDVEEAEAELEVDTEDEEAELEEDEHEEAELEEDEHEEDEEA